MQKVTETITRWRCDRGHYHTKPANAIKCEEFRVPDERKDEVVSRIGFDRETVTSVAKSHNRSVTAVGRIFYDRVAELYGITVDWNHLCRLSNRGFYVDKLNYVRRKLRRCIKPSAAVSE